MPLTDCCPHCGAVFLISSEHTAAECARYLEAHRKRLLATLKPAPHRPTEIERAFENKENDKAK